MKLSKLRSISFLVGACLLAFSTLSVGIGLSLQKDESHQAQAYTPSRTYPNGDGDTYYNGISDSLTGTNLLNALRNLNSSKRQSTVGYSAMGTSASDSAFLYTDYDPNYATTNNGVTIGTRVLSF
ncbi:MAG: hypothetical protein PHU89_03145, partial [Bacilli bacterium]|nr:hypothetical protein [Bacilli bacterium]